MRTIWVEPSDPATVWIIDQVQLPFRLEIAPIRSVQEMAEAISTLRARGAGCIGAAAAYGMALAAREAASVPPDQALTTMEAAASALMGSRPTPVNLEWAVSRQMGVIGAAPLETWVARTLHEASLIADEDVERCRRIGEHGLALLRELHARTGRTINVLTHCNAGWLAFVDHGTAIAPIYGSTGCLTRWSWTTRADT